MDNAVEPENPTPPAASQARKPVPLWLPYVLPIALYLGITFVEGEFAANYVQIYFLKIAVVAAALVWARPTWKDIRWEPKLLPVAIGAGLVLFAMWVGIEKYVPYMHAGTRSGYNPFEQIGDPGMRSAFLAVRFFGLVPFMEELFWRSFMLRYGTSMDFQDLPIGTFSFNSALFISAIFAGSHPEWVPAFLFAGAMAYLVWKTKSIFACFVAHAVTNLALGVYVLTTGTWTLW